MLLEPMIQSAVLGILQGLTEFLPISSSAHLILLPWLFDWEHFGLLFDVMVHGGTLLAILIYFHQDWRRMTWTTVRRLRGLPEAEDGALSLAVFVGTLPAVFLALAFRSLVEHYGRSPAVIVVTLSVFGLFLGWADRRGKGNRDFRKLGPKFGLLIGFAQAIALVPGVSRSGVTITAGLLLGFSRADSARFSFLLSGPIIALATLDGLYELYTSAGAGSITAGPLLVGVAVSFLTGLLCIRYFLRFLRTRTLMPFVYYRLALAAAILFIY